MTEASENALGRTPLHDWHEANGGKMVPFGGYRMPVQYKAGIIREHLATRREAGLFDVSHMGRLRVRGPNAEDYLQRMLTNNARALAPGQAHYTFIADEQGGAVDDAYLYKLADRDYLLVVNASNRAKDWAWLTADGAAAGVDLVDDSDALGMIALQGPASTAALETVLGAGALPENKRNRLSVARFENTDVIVSRTGYTGEAVCFELFPAAGTTVALWEALIAEGATAIGLGARDSLRLEASLPLYGHELGTDPDGEVIPIFANSLARFAVRTSTEEPFVGAEALARQRAVYERHVRGEPVDDEARRVLPRLIQPVAVFGGRRPLRAGQKVFHDGEPVGYLTSGTTVPASRLYGEGISARPSAEHDLRPIGLAMIDAELRYRSDRPVYLEVVDDRGNRQEAELVERNLWPTAPFTRAYRGFEAPAPAPTVDAAHARENAARLGEEAVENTRWRREKCINLIPSENCVSSFVDRLCTADPAGRYNEHNRLRALGPNAPEVRYYKGTAFIMEKEEELRAAMRAYFGCTQVEARVISGQMANDTVYDALKQFRNRHRTGRERLRLHRVLVHDLNKGGHLSAQVPGALKNYVAVDPRTERPAVEHFPFQPDHPHRIDVEATRRLIEETHPALIVFGRSVIVHREPVAPVAEFVHQHYGADNPERPVILYDGAHVLGLLGPHFQDPLAEGADFVTGSTHKTFFGPQRGIILSNIAPGSAFEGLWRQIESRAFPGHVSNHHLGTLLGLLGATYEMLHFRDDYPARVIENAKAFARALHDAGAVLEGDPACDFTETHQVLLRGARAKGEYLATLLEANNIITNPQAFHDDPSFAAASGVRMGTSEMTRYGMEPRDFQELAGLVTEIVGEGDQRPDGHWRDAVATFRARFSEMRYCFE